LAYNDEIGLLDLHQALSILHELNTLCFMHGIEDFACTFLIAEELIHIEKKVVSNIVEKMPYKRKWNYLFAKVIAHTFYYFRLI
jgi:hypothetical protein